MPYRIGSNTVITEGDATFASANASFRNFFYRYGLNPATYPGTVGSSYGYITGGVSPGGGNYTQPVPAIRNATAPAYWGAPGSFINTIERFPFATYVNSVQVGGSLSTARGALASQSSKTAGYASGGFVGIPVPLAPTTPANNIYTNITSSSVVDSFPFTSQGIITVSSAGSLSAARFSASGHQSDTSGFTSGGSTSNTNPAGVRTIDSFPFASFITATSVALLVANTIGSASHSSPTSGFTSGGFSSVILTTFPEAGAIGTTTVPLGTTTNSITRFPFSVSPVTASSVATLTSPRGYNVGVSSTINGYSCVGSPGLSGQGPAAFAPNYGATALSSIERFNFSEQTVTVASVPYSITAARLTGSGVSGTEYGYICGGFNKVFTYWSPASPVPASPYPSTGYSTIDIIPYAATTVSAGSINMTTTKGHVGGNQN